MTEKEKFRIGIIPKDMSAKFSTFCKNTSVLSAVILIVVGPAPYAGFVMILLGAWLSYWLFYAIHVLDGQTDGKLKCADRKYTVKLSFKDRTLYFAYFSLAVAVSFCAFFFDQAFEIFYYKILFRFFWLAILVLMLGDMDPTKYPKTDDITENKERIIITFACLIVTKAYFGDYGYWATGY